MDELTIFWTLSAKKQRNHVFEYWNERNQNKSYSKKLNLAIRERTKLLKTQPEIGKKTHFKNTRVISIKHYSIIYKTQQSRILILALWDNRQDAKKLLEFLKRA